MYFAATADPRAELHTHLVYERHPRRLARTRQLAKQNRVHFRSSSYNFEPRPFFYTSPDRIPSFGLGRRLGLGMYGRSHAIASSGVYLVRLLA